MRTIDLIKSHRSIRKFSTKKINPELLNDILSAGQSAATSSFVQAYSLIRITHAENRSRLAELAGNQPYVESCAEFFVCCADLARNNQLCQDLGGESCPDFIEHLIIATVDVSLVAQNMVIAAESEGLGICYIGGIRNNPQQVSELLELPDFVYPVFGLCLGYPTQDPEQKPRLPRAIWVKEDQYRGTESVQALKEYNHQVQNYYETRTGGKKSQTWSEQMRQFFSKEARPHMLDFLHSKGLARR